MQDLGCVSENCPKGGLGLKTYLAFIKVGGSAGSGGNTPNVSDWVGTYLSGSGSTGSTGRAQVQDAFCLKWSASGEVQI